MKEALLRVVVCALSLLVGGPLALLLPRALRTLGLERTNYQGRAICSGGGLLRALKGFWLLGAGLAATGPPVLAQFLGLSIPYARLEARREVMLGDTGANALGAALGVGAALVLPIWAQALALLVLVLFHAW